MSGSKRWFNLQKLVELFHAKFIFAQRLIDNGEIVVVGDRQGIEFQSLLCFVYRLAVFSRVPFADFRAKIESDRCAYLGGHDVHNFLAIYAKI